MDPDNIILKTIKPTKIKHENYHFNCTVHLGAETEIKRELTNGKRGEVLAETNGEPWKTQTEKREAKVSHVMSVIKGEAFSVAIEGQRERER